MAESIVLLLPYAHLLMRSSDTIHKNTILCLARRESLPLSLADLVKNLSSYFSRYVYTTSRAGKTQKMTFDSFARYLVWDISRHGQSRLQYSLLNK